MNGVIIGRFMPPHNGHLYLIDFARGMVDRLFILVCTLSHEPIPGELRYRWVRELAPACEVVHITEEIPEAQRGNAGATAIWAQSVRDAVNAPITHVFASEEYGWDLAWNLEAQYVPVDPSRNNIPVSASAIRANPWDNWRFIPPVVRPWFVRHLAVLNRPELAAHLADELGTVVVHPYREFWRYTWNEYAGRRDAAPLSEEQILRGGQATREALARHAERIVVHDVRDHDQLGEIERVDLLVADSQEYLSGGFDPTGGALSIDPALATAEEITRILTPRAL
jgi:HTH-type transcriptional regulator, transcriptional repressor of NAD biosynthesis genes